MKFVVSRFSQINGKWEPTQDIGSPYEDRADAELKLTQTLKAFEIFARYFHFDIREIPDPPVPEQPPLAKDCIVTEAYRGPSPNSPSSVFINYKCPKCSKSHRIALDNVWPGHKIIQCECGEN